MLERLELPLNEIKEMFKEGYTLKEIAETYFISITTVASRLRELGLFASERLIVEKNNLKEKVKELYNDETITISKIAKKLKVQDVTIYKYARELGLPKREKSLLEKIGRDKFINAYLNNRTYENVADKLNISYSAVRKYAMILGLPLKNSRKYIINEDNMEKFINMYNNNLKIIDIAKHFKTSDSVIRKTAKRLGLQNTIKVGENNEM